MYHSDIIIKHRNKSHLFWGLDKDTNEVVYISQVKSRGLHCNCRCAHCGEDFVAKLGNVNKHHFAHKSNYECVYSNEIAVYLLTKNCFRQCRPCWRQLPVSILDTEETRLWQHTRRLLAKCIINAIRNSILLF